ncbi:bacteriophage holin [Prauserella oleivorans]|uniref:Bacteriophage holin n=1 Tax=Prauserella oleivorans TaxID=1478153 RepID=A0ABW5WAM6_9PSEU
MFYVLSVVLVAAGLVVLGTVLVRVGGAVNRYQRAVSTVRADARDHLGLLRARSAALGVAVGERRLHTGPNATSEPVRSAVNE